VIDIFTYASGEEPPKLKAILSRSIETAPELEATVDTIIAEVRAEGDPAVARWTRQLDGVDLTEAGARVDPGDIERAHRGMDSGFLNILEQAAANIRRFHEAQKQSDWYLEDGDGVVLGKRIVPVQTAALLVPGASAPLFSTLLMAAIPAVIAGVDRICVATPARTDGTVHPAVLAAAHIVGVKEVYRIFGAQAVAALAYGTQTIPRADVLAGPGHPSVQIAKKRVYGDVGIDMIAGPSEIVVLADETASAREIAADLLSQAEHGSGYEAAVCITPSQTLANEVAVEVERQTADLSHADAIRRALAAFGAVVVVPDLDCGIDLVNRLAPEHLEIVVEDPWPRVEQVRNAGAIFVGPASSEPVGDYYAGTNHILPTAGAARFASSVGVATFLKNISIVAYTSARLEKTAGHIIAMAEAEGLDAHANAIRLRNL